MARYGIPYQGSKSRIAPWVVENLPTAPVLVDLFAGGCAVTHAALLSGKFGKVIANDIGEGPEIFSKALNGEYADDDTVWTREDFQEGKNDDFLHALVYSFGNNKKDYLWSRDIEPVKVPASGMILARTAKERYSYYKVFMKALVDYFQQNGKVPGDDKHQCHLQNVESLERLANIERLERLLGCKEGVDSSNEIFKTSRLDFREVVVPSNAVVYCDPPYRGTNQKGYEHAGSFDCEAFDEWLSRVPLMCVVSEYTCPNGCVEVASKQKQVSMAANGKGAKAEEKLFVQERFVDEYKRRMSE